MRNHFVALLAAIAFAFTPATVMFSVIPDAEANRPIPGYPYKDVCKNIPGKQTVLDTVGITARYRFDTTTKRKWDCVVVDRRKG